MQLVAGAVCVISLVGLLLVLWSLSRDVVPPSYDGPRDELDSGAASLYMQMRLTAHLLGAVFLATTLGVGAWTLRTWRGA